MKCCCSILAIRSGVIRSRRWMNWYRRSFRKTPMTTTVTVRLKRLRAAFPTWEAVRDARSAEVIDAIRPAGLANQKGPRIQQVLLEITEQRGSLSLDFLAELPVEEARSWLMSFKGVGPKTAAIVLLFSLDKPAFPVDTHIHRVTGRLGLRPERLSADQSHDYLEALFPPETYFTLHLNLIRLGREICQARRPRCSECPLQMYCDWNQMTNQTSACPPDHADQPSV